MTELPKELSALKAECCQEMMDSNGAAFLHPYSSVGKLSRVLIKGPILDLYWEHMPGQCWEHTVDILWACWGHTVTTAAVASAAANSSAAAGSGAAGVSAATAMSSGSDPASGAAHHCHGRCHCHCHWRNRLTPLGPTAIPWWLVDYHRLHLLPLPKAPPVQPLATIFF
ncbi:hypothetical protein CYMTET_44422 [Cymbomonas tetramitiformis]|uniref:Uncharacterized protein n=1 Tax=Cymbomonas tetramitiformis TaxID=36881 RepID=A0AAE0C097_9CHLO|nr:hypothetical protein CYMTET_44422 [Cymbomonas tetramitiformis]